MNTETMKRILRFFVAPISAILYLLAFLVKLHEHAAKIGPTAFTGVMMLVIVGWAYWEDRARQPSLIMAEATIRKHPRYMRVLASVLAAISIAIFAWAATKQIEVWRSASYEELPELRIIVDVDESMMIDQDGDIFLVRWKNRTKVDVVAQGVVLLHPVEDLSTDAISLMGTRYLIAGPRRMEFRGEILNPQRLQDLYQQGDLTTLMRLRSDATTFGAFERPLFRSETLASTSLHFRIDPSSATNEELFEFSFEVRQSHLIPSKVRLPQISQNKRLDT